MRLLRGLWTGFKCLLLLLALGALALRLSYGGGADFPDRSGEPLWPADRLELVAELPTPPGNLAVSPSGRLFFTQHPEARPQQNLMVWDEGQARPWPSAALQPGGKDPDALNEVLSIRIDRQNRLWALDNGTHGLKPGRLLAFDLDSGAVVHRYTFPRDFAGLGSHLNDFQVAPDGHTIYIADASFFAKSPAIVVYDVRQQIARRVITDHESVDAEFYTPVVQGVKMQALGLVSIRPGVDSIALSRDGDWLYFAPVTNNYLYRIASRHLRDATLGADAVRAKVQRYALKTMSDGISIDAADNVYISDLEHSAILRLSPDRELTTLVKSERLRWPDGLGFGPDNALYITCSALHQIIGKPPGNVAKFAPYAIYRLPLDQGAVAGH